MRYAAVIIEDDRERVLLLLRGPTAPFLPNRWCLPGGKIEPGERPEEAAMRETHEETSLRATVIPLVMVGDLNVFKAYHWTGRVRLADGEHVRSAWVPKEVAWTWDLIPEHREVLRWYAGSGR